MKKTRTCRECRVILDSSVSVKSHRTRYCKKCFYKRYYKRVPLKMSKLDFETGKKTCTKCLKWKLFQCFAYDKTGRNKLYCHCRECARLISKQ